MELFTIYGLQRKNHYFFDVTKWIRHCLLPLVGKFNSIVCETSSFIIFVENPRHLYLHCVCRILKIDVIWIFVGLVFSFSFVLAARENARMRKGGYSRIYFGRKKQLVVGFNFTFPNLKCHSHQCEHKNVCSVLDFRCFHSLINRHATFCRTFCYLVYTSVYHTHTESG